MARKRIRFGYTTTDYYLDGPFSRLPEMADPENTVLLTDGHVYNCHLKKFKKWNTIVLKPGEEYKIQATADNVIDQLIEMQADRKTTLVGVGGGVVTDLAGYIASIYMRGIRFGFVPTSLLAMVDASIGGKNGIDVGVYKNLVGIIRQPSFILHDIRFLDSLPEAEWRNGFAEIIKHACILDKNLFIELEKHDLADYRKEKKRIHSLVRRNALLKTKVVQQDEFETGERRMLNFGHTLGHALENQYELSHGQAVAIGMTYASVISGKITGFKEADRVAHLIERYGLPAFADFNRKKVFKVLKMDKKRERKNMNFVLLEKIGKAVVRSISLSELEELIQNV